MPFLGTLIKRIIRIRKIMPTYKKVFIVHGDEDQSTSIKDALLESQINSYMPTKMKRLFWQIEYLMLAYRDLSIIINYEQKKNG